MVWVSVGRRRERMTIFHGVLQFKNKNIYKYISVELIYANETDSPFFLHRLIHCSPLLLLLLPTPTAPRVSNAECTSGIITSAWRLSPLHFPTSPSPPPLPLSPPYAAVGEGHRTHQRSVAANCSPSRFFSTLHNAKTTFMSHDPDPLSQHHSASLHSTPLHSAPRRAAPTAKAPWLLLPPPAQYTATQTASSPLRTSQHHIIPPPFLFCISHSSPALLLFAVLF